MKKQLLITALLLSSISGFAREKMVDGLDPDSIVQSIEMKGAEGYTTKAYLTVPPNDPTDHSGFVPKNPTYLLTIIESKGTSNYIAIDTDRLSLDAKTNPKLSVNSKGSLLIDSDNSDYGSIDKWSRTLTVSYSKGKYVIAGLTVGEASGYTLKEDTCDYNLLTGKGIHAGKKVTLKTKAISLDKVSDKIQERLSTCQGW